MRKSVPNIPVAWDASGKDVEDLVYNNILKVQYTMIEGGMSAADAFVQFDILCPER